MKRRLVATASLALVGASSIGTHHVVVGLFTVACALLYMGRSASAQVFARAAAWAVIVPFAFVSWLLWTHGVHGFHWTRFVSPALAAISLVAARPLLRTEHARATFAPLAMRSWFLAAATAAIGIGIAVTGVAVELAFVHQIGSALLLGALAASLVGSGVGVVRMRGWGVLLGAISAILGAAVAFMEHRFFGWSTFFLAAPGAVTTAALLAARAGIGQSAPETPAPPARFRVASAEDASAAEEEELEAPEIRIAAISR